MAKYPSQLQDKFNLRLPDGMKDDIAERAKANGRSMNSEIVQILQDALYNISGDYCRDLPDGMSEADYAKINKEWEREQLIRSALEKVVNEFSDTLHDKIYKIIVDFPDDDSK
ncbi:MULTISPECIES: Arc family DNA-binding protein [Providencia]|uniref:Arc family DNA-binding protein n=1 Tax=Providencia TaxID=586 RepID=UPI00234B577F|nr:MULTISPECIES: Arc family DNA-binding protein [Providencia]MDT1068330.1 Arc family DNA-binding protein [Providencia stuartii]